MHNHMLSIGAAGINILCVLKAYGFWKQRNMIVEGKSGQSVNIILFSYFFFMYVTCVIYGIAEAKHSITFNGLLQGYTCVLVLKALHTYKGFQKIDIYACCVFAVFCVVMIIAPNKDWYFFVACAFGFLPICAQIGEILVYNDAGRIDPLLLILSVLNSLFWCFYGFGTDDWSVEVTSPVYLFLFKWTFFSWLLCKYNGGNST